MHAGEKVSLFIYTCILLIGLSANSIITNSVKTRQFSPSIDSVMIVTIGHTDNSNVILQGHLFDGYTHAFLCARLNQ